MFIVSHRGLIRFVSILDDGFSQPALPRRQTTAELLSSLRRTIPIVTLQHWKESLTRRIYNQHHQTRQQELPPGNVWTRCSPSRTPIDATCFVFSVYECVCIRELWYLFRDQPTNYPRPPCPNGRAECGWMMHYRQSDNLASSSYRNFDYPVYTRVNVTFRAEHTGHCGRAA